MSEELAEFKLRVSNRQHSEKIQKRLFEMGYSWIGKEVEPMFLEKPFLFTSKDGRITFLPQQEKLFYENYRKETTLEGIKMHPNRWHGFEGILEAIAEGRETQWRNARGEWICCDGAYILKSVLSNTYAPERFRVKPMKKTVEQWEAKLFYAGSGLVTTTTGYTESIVLALVSNTGVATVIQEPTLVSYEIEVSV